ncbi:MAG: tetratricopeptide repeat protein, partial [Geminicoccales bacterium]
MELALRDDEIAPLHERLEGWIAGLQLVALSLRQHREGHEDLVISGRHRFIADYLSADVLAGLPEDVRRFLLQTSILERLCGASCDAVTNGDGGQAMLETLEREGLFLVALDDSREWFRYHRLFGDFLRDELRRQAPDQLRELHRRAARWHLDRDLPEDAFRHGVAAEDVETVIHILDLYIGPKLFAGEVRVVEGWLGSAPEAWFRSHPMLGLAQATYLLITGAFDAANGWIDRVERELAGTPGEDRQGQLAKVAMLRCAVACFRNQLDQAEVYADQALRDLPDDDRMYRADTYHALGDTYSRNGRWDEARACLRKTLEFKDDPASRLRSAHVYGALADLELRQGRL